MSEVMTQGILGMPFEMAMGDELSRRKFHSRAQSLLADYARLEQECETLKQDYKEAAADAMEAAHKMRDAETERDAALKQVEGLRDSGRQLSNAAYNLAQKVGYMITEQDCEMLSDLRKRWDAELSVKS